MKKLFESWRRFVINEVEDTSELSQEDFTSPEFEAYHTALMKASKMVGHDVAIDDPSVLIYLDKVIDAVMKVKENYDFDRIMKLFNRTRMLQDLEGIIQNGMDYFTDLANMDKYGDFEQDDVVGGPIYDFSDDGKNDEVGPALTQNELSGIIDQIPLDIDLEDEEEPF